ncbi:MAG: hypothetical protein IJU60_00560 [Acholeplasmatales bacterium]|nr:hypothetical protein [Acholeplasmatales bacterium]
MRTASRTLLLVGAILSIVCILTFLIIGGVFSFVGSLSVEEIVKGINDGSINSSFEGTVQEQAEAIKLTFTVIGVVFLVLGVCCIPNAVLGFMGMKKRVNAFYVCNIVFGALSGTVVTILGGIFGLVANAQEANQQVVSE